MTISEETNRDAAVWRRLVEGDLAAAARRVGGERAFAAALEEFMSEGVDRVALMRKALRGGDWLTALYVTRHLGQPELQELLPELVLCASYIHGSLQAVRDLIRSLPRDWVVANIERAAEPLLAAGGHEEYRRLLELYSDLDAGLTERLARRAAASQDEDVREAGEDFLVTPQQPADD